MKSKVDLVIAIVSHRVVSAPTCNSLEILRLAHLKGEIPFGYKVSFFIGDALISRGRSQACTKFLEETKVPYMLFMDDDIIFTPDDVRKIYKHLSSGKYDVIGGVYPVRGASQFSSYGWGGLLNPDGNIYDIEYLATGFMGISRRILDKIKDEFTYPDGSKMPLCNPNDWARCYPFFEALHWDTHLREKGGDAIYISEDWEFCEKVRKVGGRIYADTSIQLGHIRENIYTPRDVVQNQVSATQQKQIYGALNHQGELIRSVDTDLHEFLGMTLQASQDNLKNPKKRIFEQALYHSQPSFYQDHLMNITGARDIKALVVGCGVGTVVFLLAEQNNDVLGYDPDSKCIEFCEFKKKKYKLGGNFTDKLPDVGAYDLVIALNYFQNIENLNDVMKQLGKVIVPGGKIYHVEDSPIKTANWLEGSNLKEWDGRWLLRV